MEQIRLLAKRNSIVEKCQATNVRIDDHLLGRLRLLEEYDFGFLLLGMSPRRLLRDGRLFDNELLK
jgi:hypothetical protein